MWRLKVMLVVLVVWTWEGLAACVIVGHVLVWRKRSTACRVMEAEAAQA